MRTVPSWLIAILVALVTGAAYCALAYQQWITGWVPSWDLGIFSQLAKAYASWSAPIVPIKGTGFNLLGDHFHPILVVLGPVWAIWPTPLALLVVQAVLFGLSAYPLTRYACDRFGWGFGTLLGAAYGLGWGLQSAAAAQFHEIAFAMPMLTFGLVAYLEGRLTASAIWLGLLVFVKEDQGLTIAVFAAVMWVVHPARRRLALGLAAWGVAWVALTTRVILPALNPNNQYDYTDRLVGIGASLGSLDTYVGLVLLVAALGVIGLRSPLVWLMAPTLGWRLAGNVPFYWGWQWHYSAPLMPIAFACLLESIGKLNRFSAPVDPGGDETDDPPAASPERRRPTWLGWWALALAVASTLAIGQARPLDRLTTPVYWSTWRVPGMEAALDAVPAGASVVTDLGLMAYLVATHEVYWLGSTHPTPDYVVRNEYSNAWTNEARSDLASWASRQYGVPYTMVLRQDGYVIARREA